MEDVLLYFALKYKGRFDRIYDSLKRKVQVDWDEFESLTEDLLFRYTTVLSEDYPDHLKAIHNPPFVLFYLGDEKLLQAEDFEEEYYIKDGTRRFKTNVDGNKLVAYEDYYLLKDSVGEAIMEYYHLEA